MEHLTHVWDARFDRLDAHLAALMQQQEQGTDQPDDHGEDR